VYYLYTEKHRNRAKFAAWMIPYDDKGISIRVSHYDVHFLEISTFESKVSTDSLLPRSLACGYEDELPRSP